MRRGLVLNLVGIALGLIGSLLLTSLLQSLLFGVQPHDWITFTLVSIVLLLATLLACTPPARRNTRLDPLIALRSD